MPREKYNKYVNFYDFLKEQNAEYEIPLTEQIDVSTIPVDDEETQIKGGL